MKRFHKYVDLMEAVKLKDALRSAMEMSSECNIYI
jgi:methionyl-tRNA synthetase